LRIGNINDLVLRYRIMRACNFSEKLSPLIKNNYQLFIVERMVLLGAKVLVKTWKENAGDISLSDEKYDFCPPKMVPQGLFPCLGWGASCNYNNVLQECIELKRNMCTLDL
jgi:hypothetical protein